MAVYIGVIASSFGVVKTLVNAENEADALSKVAKKFTETRHCPIQDITVMRFSEVYGR